MGGLVLAAPAAEAFDDGTVLIVAPSAVGGPAAGPLTLCSGDNPQGVATLPAGVRRSLRGPFAAGRTLVYWLAAGGVTSPQVQVTIPARGSASVPGVPVPGPATPSPGGVSSPLPPGARTPAQVLRLDPAGWYLTLPTGQPGKPDTVKPGPLATYSSEHFRLTPIGDGVIFSAGVDGVTTKNSHYPRSELREMDGGQLASWDNHGAGRTLLLEEAFLELPPVKPEVVGAQIHDARSDVIELMLSGTRLGVRHGDGQQFTVLDSAYRLGTRFRAVIVAARDKVAVSYNDGPPLVLGESGSGWYWKVGCYVQSNLSKGDRPGARGEVVVYRAEVTKGAAGV